MRRRRDRPGRVVDLFRPAGGCGSCLAGGGVPVQVGDPQGAAVTILGLYVFLAVIGVAVLFVMVVMAADLAWQRRTSRKRRPGYLP